MARLSRDTLERDKTGSPIREEHRQEAVRARVEHLLTAGPDMFRPETARQREARELYEARLAGDVASGNRPPSREAVLKIVNWTKSAAAPYRQAEYVARTADDQRHRPEVPMENEKGEQLTGKDQVRAEITSWGLIKDADNLSKAAREATAEERAAMPQKDKLKANQAVHMIFSVPAHAGGTPPRLRAAVSGALRETFGEKGFRYVFAIHTDHSKRPHVHVIVKARSEAVNGRRAVTLQIHKAELAALRQVFTRHSQEQGIKVIATRRMDRPDLRQQIEAGKEPLRDNKKMAQSLPGRRRDRQEFTFEKAAPAWYARHGEEYARRRAAAAMQIDAPKREDLHAQRPTMTPALQDEQKGRGFFERFKNFRAGRAREADRQPAADRRISADRQPSPDKLTAYFAKTTKDPIQAVESFKALHKEAPKLALWAAKNHLIAFAEPTNEKARFPMGAIKELPAQTKERATISAGTTRPREIEEAADRARRQALGPRAAREIELSHRALAMTASAALRYDPRAAEKIEALQRVAGTAPPAPTAAAPAITAGKEAQLRQRYGRSRSTSRSRDDDRER